MLAVAVTLALLTLPCVGQEPTRSADLPIDDSLLTSPAWESPEELPEAGLFASCDEFVDDSCSAGACRKSAWNIFGEFLYMRPRNAEVVFAVPFNGPIAPPPAVPVQVGRVGVVDPDYEPAFRVGFARVYPDGTSLGATYTRFESSTFDQINTAAPYVIRSMVAHPFTLGATSDGLDANATLDVDFHLVDLDYREEFACGRLYSLNYLVGARYAGLGQEFRSQYAVNGVETVDTSIRFDGGGIRLGLEGETRSARSGFLLYGRGIASFVGGEFRATYAQGEDYDASVVDTGWSAGRIVSILDLEIGLGWVSPNECWRFTGGYFVSAWYNTVMTNEFIAGVQTNNFLGLGNTMTFDGLSVRAEVRF
ncbi:MAG TPA: Lpg1974 family pore-forming outer membrane protein [Thermoguttaceae bacterium]|nr:Lpg1974 family pore-forming outer membrane protein [Thermoguttaceae bacterium]